MTLMPAPFFDDVADAPTGQSWWATTDDGVRIRIGYWPCDNARGTVLLFPGRTEYVEKYSSTAGSFAGIGMATVAIDWRGQGLADRLMADRRVGHVNNFVDYQQDVAATIKVARAVGMPEPYHVLGHSMGGAIGLRALIEGLPVATCVFTGPMWGIYLSPLVRPFGYVLPGMAQLVGMGQRLAPGTRGDSYVQANPFEGNMLTGDADMYRMMQQQMDAHPDLGLGGPSMVWLRQALSECRYLARQPSPDVPCLTFLGAREQIINCPSVHARMQRWPKGQIDVVPESQHEVLMETPPIRKRVFAAMDRLFSGETASAALACSA